MKNNKIAKALQVIGIVEIICGVFGWLPVAAFMDLSQFLTLCYWLTCVITGIIFLGFSEIITLLQQNADYQRDILKLLQINSDKAE